MLAPETRLQIAEVRGTDLTGLPGTVRCSWEAIFLVLKLRKSQANQDKLIMLLEDYMSFNKICVYVCDMHGSRPRIPLAHV